MEKPSAIRQALLSYVADALDHAPSVVVFDDLDSIVAASSESEASQPSSSSAVLAEYFADIMDEYEVRLVWPCVGSYFNIYLRHDVFDGVWV